jgi:very-short-patch-repair endonuclease
MDKINFRNLVNYYLDCLLEDSANDVSAFASGRNLSYLELEEPELSTRSNSCFTPSESSKFKSLYSQQIQGNRKVAWWYGFPNTYKTIQSKKGWTGGIITPLFMLPVNLDHNNVPTLADSFPKVNLNALTTFNISLEEAKRIIAELDIYSSDSQGTLTSFLSRFKSVYPGLPWKLNSRGTKFSSFSESDYGIYEKGIIYASESSNYTHGLEYELNRLLHSDGNLPKTAIGTLLTDNIVAASNPITVKQTDIIEAFPLNEQQKESVLSALNSPLTVITGPPGTGKSQVVASIVLNASKRGERVFVASKNHKAVDVVEERINGLLVNPFIIRLGSKGTDNRNIQQELLKYLTSILGSGLSGEVRNQLQTNEAKINQLRQKRNGLHSKIEEYRINRNKLLSLSLKYEQLTEKLSKEKAAQILRKRRLNNSSFTKLEFLLLPTWRLIAEYADNLDKISKMDSLEELCSQLSRLEDQLLPLYKKEFELWTNDLPNRLDPDKRQTLSNIISVLGQLAAADNTVPRNTIASLLRQKEKLMRDLTGFLPAWCITNLSANGHLPFESGFFDLVVIDEASQCDIPSALPLLFRAKRAVIIGDPNQLQFIASMNISRSLNLMKSYRLDDINHSSFEYTRNSLFKLAAGKAPQNSFIMLNEHFRSHSDIIGFSNKVWYNGSLSVATNYAGLNPKLQDGCRAVEWIDIPGKIEQVDGAGAYNTNEIDKVVSIVMGLVADSKYKGEIGVVTSFRHQANKIREELVKRLPPQEWTKHNMLVDTTVKFQGDERDIIILSMMVSKDMPKGVKYYLESTLNLLNVSITRARAKLIIVGDFRACLDCGIQTIKDFAIYVNQLTENHIKESDGNLGFESIYEEILFNELQKHGIIAIPQYNVDQYRLDFAVITKDKKIDIEVDGVSYHTDWTGHELKSDVTRNLRLQKLGWTVLRFWSYEIRDNVEACINRIISKL